MQHIQIREELSKFINLLQSGKSTPTDERNHQYTLSKKLSVILSASEPDSSCLDKENSNPSANRSFQTNQKPLETSYHSIFQNLFKSQLTTTQTKLLQKLKELFEQMRCQIENNEARMVSLKRAVSMEKRANDEMLGVLMKLDAQEKQLWNSYHIVSKKYEEAAERAKQSDQEFLALQNSLFALQNDNQFMKKLIFHANENYQALEHKCQQLQTQREKSQANTDRSNRKNSSIDNLIKSAKTKKNGRSPSPAHSEIQNSPSVDDFQKIYRKMIVRTLKFKGRQQQFR